MSVTGHVQRLSRRVRALQPSSTLAVTARVKALRAAGHDVIGFGAGEPDFDTPEHVKQAAIRALEAGMTSYMPVAGEPSARAAIAAKLRAENGIECEPEHVVITNGGKHALYALLQCLLDDEDDEVILPTPAWVSYQPMIELAGGRVVELPTTIDTAFRVSPDRLEAAITPRTRAFVLNSPSNPCGTMYAPDELRALAAVLERHDHVTIITDEIYEKLVYGDVEHFSLGSLPSVAPRVVTVNGLSKSFAMTGWRIGYACAPGDDGAIARAMTALQSQMTSSITSFVYPAIVEALENGAEAVERMRVAFAERATLCYELVTALPEVSCARPIGAFYVFPDLAAHLGRTSPGGRRLDSVTALAEALLEEERVAIVPGEAFGACARTHARLSFACDTPRLEEGLRRIDRWLRRLA